MHGIALAIAIFLIALPGLSSAVLAQCTDADSDGYFYESGCGTLEDCNDAAAGTHPGALELCDGYDNDCDGLIDNHSSCVTSCPAPQEVAGGPVSVSVGPADERQWSLVWNGAEYGVAWRDDRTGSTKIYFARLDVAGNKIGGDTELAPGHHPSLVWTGTEYAVAYADVDIFLQRIDASGNPIGGASQVAQSGGLPSLAWTGSEYGLAWRSDGIQFKRIDATGQEIPASQVTVRGPGGISPDPTSFPELVWNGNGYGVGYVLNEWVVGSFWVDEIYFQALDGVGNLIGSPLKVSDGVDVDIGLAPALAWSGSEFGVAWHTGISILFSRVDSNGNRIGGTVTAAGPLTIQAIFPDIAWTGGEYGLAWDWYRQSDGSQVYLTRLDSAGGAIDDDVQATEVYGASSAELAWNGTEYGMVWGEF